MTGAGVAGTIVMAWVLTIPVTFFLGFTPFGLIRWLAPSA